MIPNYRPRAGVGGVTKRLPTPFVVLVGGEERFKDSVAGLFGLSGLSRFLRSLNQTNQRNQIDQTDQMNQLPTTHRECLIARPDPITSMESLTSSDRSNGCLLTS